MKREKEKAKKNTGNLKILFLKPIYLTNRNRKLTKKIKIHLKKKKTEIIFPQIHLANENKKTKSQKNPSKFK